MEGVDSRITAWRALRRVRERGAWAGPAIAAELAKSALDTRDRAFAASLAHETLRWEGTLDWALRRVSSRPLEQIEPGILDVLRLGAWQLLYADAPARAAVATTVETTRQVVGERATGFVNGVLRALAREAERLPWPSTETDEGLGLVTGYPGWIAAEARGRFGSSAPEVLAAGNTAPGVTLRVDGDVAAVAAELRSLGFDPQPGVAAAAALRVPGADPGRLAAVREGRATVQDEASMLVVHALTDELADEAGALPAEMVVADLAAAPGGKATHLAALGAQVVAGDRDPRRLRLVVESAERLQSVDTRRLHVVAADAAVPPLRPGTLDAVLLDAPCTGLGVVRRRPEVRWRRESADPASLGAVQLRLLEAAATLVRPGGRVCYSVCTWTVAETVAVIRGFLAAHGDCFAPLAPPARVREVARDIDGDPGIQLESSTAMTDGMYICLLERRCGPRAVSR